MCSYRFFAITVITCAFYFSSTIPTHADWMTVGDMTDGTCDFLPGWAAIASDYDGGVGCGGGRVFQSDTQGFLTSAFSYQGKWKGAYAGVGDLPTNVQTRIAADQFRGKGRLKIDPRYAKVKIASQIESTIKEDVISAGYGADGAVKFLVSYVDDDLEDDEEIPIEIGVRFSMSLSCQITANCNWGYNLSVSEDPLGLDESVLEDFGVLQVGPDKDNFFIPDLIAGITNCFFNDSTNTNDCVVDGEFTFSHTVKNRLTYGGWVGSFGSINAAENVYVNVNNGFTTILTFSLTDENPDARLVIIPEPATALLLLAAGTFCLTRRFR